MLEEEYNKEEEMEEEEEEEEDYNAIFRRNAVELYSRGKPIKQVGGGGGGSEEGGGEKTRGGGDQSCNAVFVAMPQSYTRTSRQLFYFLAVNDEERMKRQWRRMRKRRRRSQLKCSNTAELYTWSKAIVFPVSKEEMGEEDEEKEVEEENKENEEITTTM